MRGSEPSANGLVNVDRAALATGFGQARVVDGRQVDLVQSSGRIPGRQILRRDFARNLLNARLWWSITRLPGRPLRILTRDIFSRKGFQTNVLQKCTHLCTVAAHSAGISITTRIL